MKILNISLDKNIIDKDSAVAKRIIEYGKLVEKYSVIVPANKNDKIKLSENAEIFAICGNVKLVKLVKLYKIGKRLLKEEKYDVISVQDQYYLGWIGLKLARKFKIGLEVQIHGFEKYSGTRKMIAKKVIKNADAVRVVSQRLKGQLVEEFGIEEEKITVVPIYSEHTTCNTQHVTRKDKFIFLTVGRLVPVKNIGMQIEAMNNEKLPACRQGRKMNNVELWIVGDGTESKKLSSYAKASADKEVRSKDLGLEQNIKFLGRQENLENFYKQADVFLLTSNSEGWGLVVIEAASYGLPIIMTDVGCAGEVIKNEESGLVIPVGDQKKLEEAMIRLIEDEDLRKKIGQGAEETIKKLPTKKETLKLYKESWEKAKYNTNDTN